MAQGTNWNDRMRRMFGSISSRYDILNTLISFGMDQILRRRVIGFTTLPPGGTLLDVGAGTGKITLAALKRFPDARIVAADLTPEMMKIGMKRTGAAIHWCCADALSLPFPDMSFDAVVSGFLVRNVEDIQAAFAEQVRVVRPGGVVICLDTNPPPDTIMRPLIRVHLDYIIPILGTLMTGNRAAYSYLPESTKSFKTPEELAYLMESAGLEKVSFRRYLFGAMIILKGARPVVLQAH